MSSQTSVLEPLRVRVRRFQFIMGLGFIALIAGSLLSVALMFRLSVRIQALPLGVLRTAFSVLVENLWVFGVLPVLCYGAARVMELRPWTTAGGAALTGAAFLNAMAFIQRGVSGLWIGDIGSLFSLVAFAGGVVLSARAVMMGREAAAQQSVKTQAKAEERKSEYDEFLLAAEQGAARLEQREAQSAVVSSGGALAAAAIAATVASEAIAGDAAAAASQAPASDGAEPASGASAQHPGASASSAAEGAGEAQARASGASGASAQSPSATESSAADGAGEAQSPGATESNAAE